jgi:hypothetical protein
MRKRPQVKRISKKRASKLDVYITSVIQDWINDSTEDITRKRGVLICEANAVESEITALTSKLTDARAHRTRVEATLNALAMVVEQRAVERR